MTSAVAAVSASEIIEVANDKARQLEQQVKLLAAASVDAIADTRTLRMVAPTNRSEGDNFPARDRVQFEVVKGGQGLGILISDMAHDQIAQKVDIDKKYYQRMLVNQPQLLCENVNTWLAAEPAKRMLRMMKGLTLVEAGEIASLGATYRLRAFLASSYRPLDNVQLVETVLPVMQEHGAYLSDFSLTDQRLHAKFLTFEREIKNFQAIEIGEIIRMGVYLRNSETGFASLDVSGTIEIKKCHNGLIAPAATRVRHVQSKRNGGEDELDFLSAQTQRLDNAAIFSRVRDTAVAALDENAQSQYAARILSAKATIINPEAPMFEFIGRIGERFELTETEQEVLKEEVVRSNMIEGNFTQFSLSQGMTATARQLDNYDRRVELERAGWEIVSNDTKKLLEAGKQSAKRKN